MKNLIIIQTIIFLYCTSISAQSKWYLAPSIGMGNTESRDYFSAGLTIGHKICENKFRIDVWGVNIFANDKNIYSAAALFTLGEFDYDHEKKVNSIRFLSTGSIGMGIQKSEKKDRIDIILPFRFYYGLPLAKKLTLGFDGGVNFNLSDFKNGSKSYWGFCMGIRF